MKKGLCILLALLLVMLAGCQNQASSSLAEIVSAVPEEPASSSAPQQEGSIEGEMTDGTMNTVQIKADDGTLYLFTTDGATVESDNGLLIGDELVIYYEDGELEKSDNVQQVVVTRIVVTGQVDRTIDGTISAVDQNSLQLQTGGGVTCTFSLEGASIEAGSNGLQAGDTVTVHYRGILASGEDAQSVTVTRVVLVSEPEHQVDGTVINASMNTIEIKTSHGVDYLFSTQGAAIDPGSNGLIVGDVVRIYFTGTLDKNQQQQNVTVDRVTVIQQPGATPAPPPQPAPASSHPTPSSSSPPASSSSKPAPSSSQPAPSSSSAPPPPPTPPETHMINGTITNVSMNVLQIEAPDGTSYTFSVEDITIESGDNSQGVIVGDTVSVFYTGTLDPGSANVQDVVVTRVAISGWGGAMLSGTVTDASMNTLTLTLADGTVATFASGDAPVDAGTSGLAVGVTATVYFTGAVDFDQEVQPVTVVRVIVQ